MVFLFGITGHPYFQALGPLRIIFFACAVALPPLILHLLTHPFKYLVSTIPIEERIHILQSKFFFYAWRFMGSGDQSDKIPLLTQAKGTVLEIGAGLGDSIRCYTSKVTRLILVEPNTDMHPALRRKANESGFTEHDGSLLILGCGGAPSDEKALNLAGVIPNSVDSITVIQVLCGIPDPAQTIEMYRRLLKPDGVFIFYEHVRSEEPFSASCQSWYTRIIWRHFFDGCCLDRPTGAWIMAGPDAAHGKELITGKELAQGVDGVNPVVQERWSDYQISAPNDQARFALLPRVIGWAIKA